MSYRFWEREFSDYEDFEIRFFDERKSNYPIKILHSTAMDSQCRREERMDIDRDSLSHVGCYLFFDSYQSSAYRELLPLYVGKSNKLMSRLSSHWGATKNFVLEYQDAWVNKADFLRRQDYVLLGDRYDYALPTGTIWVAYWHQNNERDRLFMEHELIYKFRPIYNRA